MPAKSPFLYNAETSDEDFATICPDTSVNKIPVTGWSAMALNNGGDTIALWDDYTQYVGDPGEPRQRGLQPGIFGRCAVGPPIRPNRPFI